MTGNTSGDSNSAVGVLGVGLTLGITLMIQWGASIFGS